MVNEENSISTLQEIDERRKLLHQVVAVARAIEDLQHSLNAVLVLGDTTTPLPNDAYQLYQNLTNQVREESTERVQEFHQQLQQLIKSELDQILAYSRLEEDESGEIQLTEDAIELVQGFRRKAQTAVSLRVLLKERGVSVAGETLSVPEQEIHAQLSHLDEKEQQQRKKIRQQMCLMQEDLQQMIATDAYSEAIKQPMKQALIQLDADLVSIDSGASIESLDLSFEAVETEEKLYDADSLSTVEPSLTEKPKPEDVGFLKKVDRWLNTPWGVSWNGTRKNDKDTPSDT